MGKSLELLGLASLNVLVALILSVTVISRTGHESRHMLTERTVTDFVEHVSSISTGKQPDMDAFRITEFFMKHVAADGKFKTVVRYSAPDVQDNTREIELDKMSFIAKTLEGLKMAAGHEALSKIEHIAIDDGGKSASVITTNYERAMMPVADENSETTLIPVQGTSYCEEKIILTEKNIIQISSASCTTDMAFSGD